MYIALTTPLDNVTGIVFDSKSDLFHPPHLLIDYVSNTTTTSSEASGSSFIGFLVIGFIIQAIVYSIRSNSKKKFPPIYNQPPIPPMMNQPINQPVVKFCTVFGKQLVNPTNNFCDNCETKIN